MMVLRAPGSSARRKRRGCRGNMDSYAPMIWCGNGSTSDVWTAKTGSKRCASRIRGAPETNRNCLPLPSKLHGPPCSTSSRRGSSWRYSSTFRLSRRVPSMSVQQRKNQTTWHLRLQPKHPASTPRKDASGRRSSSLVMSHHFLSVPPFQTK